MHTFIEHFICFIKNQHFDRPCPQISASYHVFKKKAEIEIFKIIKIIIN